MTLESDLQTETYQELRKLMIRKFGSPECIVFQVFGKLKSKFRDIPQTLSEEYTDYLRLLAGQVKKTKFHLGSESIPVENKIKLTTILHSSDFIEALLMVLPQEVKMEAITRMRVNGVNCSDPGGEPAISAVLEAVSDQLYKIEMLSRLSPEDRGKFGNQEVMTCDAAVVPEYSDSVNFIQGSSERSRYCVPGNSKELEFESKGRTLAMPLVQTPISRPNCYNRYEPQQKLNQNIRSRHNIGPQRTIVADHLSKDKDDCLEVSSIVDAPGSIVSFIKVDRDCNCGRVGFSDCTPDKVTYGYAYANVHSSFLRNREEDFWECDNTATIKELNTDERESDETTDLQSFQENLCYDEEVGLGFLAQDVRVLFCNRVDLSSYKAHLPASKLKFYLDSEDAMDNLGTGYDLCENCPCRAKSAKLKIQADQEKAEQECIDQSIWIDLEDKITWADLPLLKTPTVVLTKRHHGNNNYG